MQQYGYNWHEKVKMSPMALAMENELVGVAASVDGVWADTL